MLATSYQGRHRNILLLILVLLTPILPAIARAPAGEAPRDPSEVLLVCNANSPTSVAIAEYYATRRKVTNRLAVSCRDSAASGSAETIPLANYDSQIAMPISTYLAHHATINFIVLTRGMPIRIGGQDVGHIPTGSFTSYNDLDFSGAHDFSARVASDGPGGNIEVRIDRASGPLLGTCKVPHTGGWQKWTTAKCALSGAAGIHKLFLVYTGGGGFIFNIATFSLSGIAGRIEAAGYDGSSADVQVEDCSEGGALTGSEDEHQAPQDFRPSVDSYLAAFDYPRIADAAKASLTGSGATGIAWVNRYFNATAPFSHARFGGYLVTRIDGYTEADAKALVDRSLAAERGPLAGTILCDVPPDFGLGDKTAQPLTIPSRKVTSEDSWGNWNADMIHISDILEASGIPHELAISKTFIGHRSNLLGYYSWGSNDNHYDANAYESLSFAPGAIGDTAVSTSARSFFPQTSGQSMIADLVAHGITGVQGYTNEPLLDATSSPTIVLTHYLSGSTLAESFYAGSKYIGWEGIVIGDPLCCPYRTAPREIITPIQATGYSGMNSVKTEACSESASDVCFITSGSNASYDGIDVKGKQSFMARVASGGSGGSIEIHLDQPTGEIIGTCPVPATGGWQQWTTVSCAIRSAAGNHRLVLAFNGGGGNLFNLEWFALSPERAAAAK
jgi:uncharacterized protein (TIGR03790 family)